MKTPKTKNDGLRRGRPADLTLTMQVLAVHVGHGALYPTSYPTYPGKQFRNVGVAADSGPPCLSDIITLHA